LGRDIAEAALGRRGQRGSRSASDGRAGTLVAQYGERMKPVRLEVRDEAAAKAAVQLAWTPSGGWTFWSTMPVMAVCALRADECGGLPGDRGTCFYGVVYTTRAAVR